MKMQAQLNNRERRAQQLLAHYATCERLSLACGMKAADIDGKKISVALFKIERDAGNAATAQCNGEACQGQPYRTSAEWEEEKEHLSLRVAEALGGKIPPAFFINGDPRGYALKIDNDKPEGAALIAAVKLHTDWGGYGILSPEITGN